MATTATHSEIVDAFTKGAVIAYPELSARRGLVLAKYHCGFIWHRHESEPRSATKREPAAAYLAARRVPYTARLHG